MAIETAKVHTLTSSLVNSLMPVSFMGTVSPVHLVLTVSDMHKISGKDIF